jgi:hypothetical protein
MNPPGAPSVYGLAQGLGAQVPLHDRAIAPQKVRWIACWVPTGGHDPTCSLDQKAFVVLVESAVRLTETRRTYPMAGAHGSVY